MNYAGHEKLRAEVAELANNMSDLRDALNGMEHRYRFDSDVLTERLDRQQEIRLMGYSFTSLEVAGHLSGQNTGVSMWAWFWTGKLMPGRTTTPVKQP